MIRHIIAIGFLTIFLFGQVGAQGTSRALGGPVAWQVIYDQDIPTISGVVIGSSGAPMDGVQVVLEGTTTGALSDKNGLFQFPAPSPGEWVLQFQYIGFATIEEPIAFPVRSSVRVAAIMARPTPICSNICPGTLCTDLGIQVQDGTTGRPPTVPIKLRVEFKGEVLESTTPPNTRIGATHTWVGLGSPIETVGFHTLEVSAPGFRTWRAEKVWLEKVPLCHGLLIGRDHTVLLEPERLPSGAEESF